MKDRAVRVLGLGAFAGLLLGTQACSSDADKAASPNGGTRPPAESGGPTTSTEERTYAVDALAMGDATRGGVKDDSAWKSLGYNQDNLVTNVEGDSAPDLARVCKRADKAPASVHQDGDGGIDNAFGKTVIPILAPITVAPSKEVTASIASGSFTILLKVTGLTDDPAQTNTGLSATLLVGANFDPSTTDVAAKRKPSFTTADDWPYDKTPQTTIANAFINDGTFVNGKGDASVPLTLSVGGQPFSFTIKRALISFKHDAAGDSLAEGTIAGVIDTNELVSAVATVAGHFNQALCSGSLLESVKDQIRQASDMLSDGTQDPAKSCDGISVGIGFTAKRVGSPTQAVDPAPPAPSVCP